MVKQDLAVHCAEYGIGTVKSLVRESNELIACAIRLSPTSDATNRHDNTGLPDLDGRRIGCLGTEDDGVEQLA